MQIIVLYLTTAGFFLLVDAVMLKNFMQPHFQKYLGDWLRQPIDLAAAGGFYLLYVAGVLYLVSLPALREGSVGQAALGGAILGGLAYGTYEFTNKATLTRWDWSMVAADWTWGIVLTGASAAFGVWATRALTGN